VNSFIIIVICTLYFLLFCVDYTLQAIKRNFKVNSLQAVLFLCHNNHNSNNNNNNNKLSLSLYIFLSKNVFFCFQFLINFVLCIWHLVWCYSFFHCPYSLTNLFLFLSILLICQFTHRCAK